MPPKQDPTQEEAPGALSRKHGRHADLSFFTSASWFDHLSRTALPSDAMPLFLKRERDSEELCFPLMLRTLRRTRRVESLATYYSPIFHPITPPGDLDFLVEELAHHVAAPEHGVDVVDLRPLDTTTPFYTTAQAALRRAGFWIDTYFCMGNWFHEVKGKSFDQYFEERPSSVRNTVRRARRKLEERDLRIEVVSGGGDLDRAVAAFTNIYDQSWKQTEPYPDFIAGLCRLAAKEGCLRLGLMWVEGEPAAAQIWLVKGGIASIFKLAYNGKFAKQSPGSVLTAEMMRHAIDLDKVEIIDYLSGDDPYKRDWMSQRRERRGIVAFNKRRPRGVLEAAKHFVGQRIKAATTRREEDKAGKAAIIEPKQPD